MPEIFFTADHHFFHDGIISMCGRPFASTDEMNEVLIERWNDVVRPGDTVYHLGDFAMKGTAEGIAEIFRGLKGRKHLIIGNHDRPRTRDLPWASPPQQRVFLRHPGEKAPMVLDHYSMRTWPGAHHGAVHLYGHSHGNLPGIGRSLDAGVDCWDFRPVTLAELRPVLEKQHEKFERQREAARMFRERAARGDPEAALAILRRVPDVAPEPEDELWDEMLKLRDGDYDQALRVGTKMGVFKQPLDPLGYDTSDSGSLLRMTEDALAGRNEDAVEAEVERVRLLLPAQSRADAPPEAYAKPQTVAEQAKTFAALWTGNRAAAAAGIEYGARVVEDPAVLGGEPLVSGTTVPASAVLEAIRSGSLDFEIRAAFPTLPEDGVDAVRKWADEQGRA